MAQHDDKDRDMNRPNQPGKVDVNRPGQTDPNRPGQTDPNRPGQGGQGGGMNRPGQTGYTRDDEDEETHKDAKQNREDETDV